MNQNIKSATTAGILGIMLGAFGAHNWYLGEKGKSIAHICLMSGGIFIEIFASLIIPSIFGLAALAVLAILAPLATISMAISGIWGLTEGITILSQGDAGLARRGFAVANAATSQNFFGQQPMNPTQPMNAQPVSTQQTNPFQPLYAQPATNVQPVSAQPVDTQPVSVQPATERAGITPVTPGDGLAADSNTIPTSGMGSENNTIN